MSSDSRLVDVDLDVDLLVQQLLWRVEQQLDSAPLSSSSDSDSESDELTVLLTPVRKYTSPVPAVTQSDGRAGDGPSVGQTPVVPVFGAGGDAPVVRNRTEAQSVVRCLYKRAPVRRSQASRSVGPQPIPSPKEQAVTPIRSSVSQSGASAEPPVSQSPGRSPASGQAVGVVSPQGIRRPAVPVTGVRVPGLFAGDIRRRRPLHPNLDVDAVRQEMDAGTNLQKWKRTQHQVIQDRLKRFRSFEYEPPDEQLLLHQLVVEDQVQDMDDLEVDDDDD